MTNQIQQEKLQMYIPMVNATFSEEPFTLEILKKIKENTVKHYKREVDMMKIR